MSKSINAWIKFLTLYFFIIIQLYILVEREIVLISCCYIRQSYIISI